MTTKVVVLGATGSVGRQALEVVRGHPERFEVVALVAGSDEAALTELARSFPQARTGLGEEAAVEAAGSSDADVVLNAIVGAAGLRASLAALGAGTTLALANKESLIAGGALCLAACDRTGATIVPVDSEHAALAQCLEGRDRATVTRAILTASGGPFRTRSDLSDVTVADALVHPTWSMGPKITVDSATLMNKGLEVIEAHFLFGFSPDEIDVVVHPQSTIHALIELVDGSFVMQAAPPDMRIPIQAGLSAPDRLPALGSSLEPHELGALTFEPLDRTRFPAVDLAYAALRAGGTAPATLNAANEVAVEAFLAEELSFAAITDVVAAVVERHEPVEVSSLDDVLAADADARRAARGAITKIAGTVGSAR